MFQGNAIINLDDKGRIIIPSKFRRHIKPEANSVVFVTLGRDNCLWLYPSDEWTKVEEILQGLSQFTKDEVNMRRQMLYHADDYTLDSQHRITLPQKLLSEVNIKKEILLVGQLEKVELWDPTTYEKYTKSNEDSYEDIMEKVMKKYEEQKKNQIK